MSDDGLTSDAVANARDNMALSGSPSGIPANPHNSGKHGVPAGQQQHQQAKVAKKPKHDKTPENPGSSEITMTPGQNEFVAECKAMQMSPSK
jgi:hypothetical protein